MGEGGLGCCSQACLAAMGPTGATVGSSRPSHTPPGGVSRVLPAGGGILGPWQASSSSRDPQCLGALDASYLLFLPPLPFTLGLQGPA